MAVIRITRFYQKADLKADKLPLVREIMIEPALEWGHNRVAYELHFSNQVTRVSKADDIADIIAHSGNTSVFYCYFESNTGRRMELDATRFDNIRIEVRDHTRNPALLIQSIEERLKLTAASRLPRVVLVAHGTDLQSIEYAQQVRRFLELLGIEVNQSVAPQTIDPMWIDLIVAIRVLPEDDAWIRPLLKYSPLVLVEGIEERIDSFNGNTYHFSKGIVATSFLWLLEKVICLRNRHTAKVE